MPFEFYLAYVHVFAVLIPGMALVMLAIGVARAGVNARVLIAPGLLLGFWYAGAMYLSQTGILNVPATLSDPPFVLMLLIGGAVLIWALARRTAIGRRITDAIDPGMIIAFQIPRAMGGLFVLGWITGDIPWQFALPAGLGDIWAGIAGYQAWRAWDSGAEDARRKILQANMIGIADFAVAVLTGIMTSEGFLHLMAHDSPNIINLHPLAMFPGFFVPLFLGFHLISLSQLRRSSRAIAATA